MRGTDCASFKWAALTYVNIIHPDFMAVTNTQSDKPVGVDSLWVSPLLLLQMNGSGSEQSACVNCGRWSDQLCRLLQPCSSICWWAAGHTNMWLFIIHTWCDTQQDESVCLHHVLSTTCNATTNYFSNKQNLCFDGYLIQWDELWAMFTHI